MSGGDLNTSRCRDGCTHLGSEGSYSYEYCSSEEIESPASEYSDCEYCEARRQRNQRGSQLDHREENSSGRGSFHRTPSPDGSTYSGPTSYLPPVSRHPPAQPHGLRARPSAGLTRQLPLQEHRLHLGLAGNYCRLATCPLCPGTPRLSPMACERAPLLGSLANCLYKSTGSTSDSLGPGELSSDEILSSLKKRSEMDAKPEGKKQSSLITIFSVWNTVMGSSLLTMAWGVERAGLPAALLLFAIMSAVCLYTAYVLLRVNHYHGSATCEVPALCRRLLGRGAEAVAHVFSLLVLLGANVVYWILITNFLYFTVNYFIDLRSSNSTSTNETVLCPSRGGLNGSLLIPAVKDDPPYWGLHSTVPLYVALIVFPLLNFKDVSFFTKFNSLGTLSVAYLLVFVVAKGAIWGVNIPTSGLEPRAGKDAAVLSGMLALSFYIHNIIITIMSNNARHENNGRDLTIAFVLVTATYTLVGAVFYVCFPLAKSCIEDNLLNNFEIHDVMTALARVLLLFQVVTVYPLIAFMLRSEAVLLLPCKQSTRLTVAINAVIVAVCIAVACLCPSIGTIIRYTGAVSGLVHIFALPSLLQIRSLQLRGRLTWWKGAFYAGIMLFGAGNLAAQFFIDE